MLRATFWGAELKAVRLLPYRLDDGTFAPRRIRGADVLAESGRPAPGPSRRLRSGMRVILPR